MSDTQHPSDAFPKRKVRNRNVWWYDHGPCDRSARVKPAPKLLTFMRKFLNNSTAPVAVSAGMYNNNKAATCSRLER